MRDARLRALKVLSGPAGKIQRRPQGVHRAGAAGPLRFEIVSYARVSCRWRRRRRSTSGRWISAQSPCSGAAAASSCAVFLERIKEAFAADPKLENLLLDRYFQEATAKAQLAWRHVIASAVHLGIPTPAFSAALAYYDGYRAARLPAHLLQAQRDYFGAILITGWIGRACFIVTGAVEEEP